MYQIIDANTFAVLFEFDCEQSESAELSVQWTDKPIETGANVARYGIEQPEAFEIEGLVTATPFDLPHSFQRVIDADQLLRTLARARQPVFMVSGYYAKQVVITTVGSGAAAGDPEQLRIRVGLKTVFLTTPETVNMPPARMKPRVKKRASPAKKGGAQSGKTGSVTAAEKQRAKGLVLKGLLKAGVRI